MQKTKGRRIILPPSVRELQKPFFSKKIDPDLESLMRFNGKVCRHFGTLTASHYLSGGAGTMMEEVVSEQFAAEFDKLSKDLYLQPRAESKEQTAFAQEKLRAFLKERGVVLESGNGSYDNQKLPNLHHSTYELILEVLSLLPDHHLTSEHFSKLSLGGWGGGAAKCSQYIDQEVHIYQFVLRGARRNLIGILLHEVGHSFYEMLSFDQKQALHNFRKLLARKSKSDIFGVAKPELVLAADFLHGPESRIPYSLGTTKEFIPESYMHYITQGAFTAEGLAQRHELAKSENDASEISHFDSFKASIPPKLAKAYNALWKFFRQEFDGIEYV